MSDWRAEQAARLAAITGALDALDVTMTAEFVPQSKSRYPISADGRRGGYAGKGEPCITWRVTVLRHGRAIAPAFDYSQGAAHLWDSLRSGYGAPGSNCYRAAEREACETRQVPGGPELTPPTLADVMHSLLLDGSADDVTFEEWCADYGYDVDSRKAYATYEACRDTGQAFRRAFGADGVERLRELFADY